METPAILGRNSQRKQKRILKHPTLHAITVALASTVVSSALFAQEEPSDPSISDRFSDINPWSSHGFSTNVMVGDKSNGEASLEVYTMFADKNGKPKLKSYDNPVWSHKIDNGYATSFKPVTDDNNVPSVLVMGETKKRGPQAYLQPLPPAPQKKTMTFKAPGATPGAHGIEPLTGTGSAAVLSKSAGTNSFVRILKKDSKPSNNKARFPVNEHAHEMIWEKEENTLYVLGGEKVDIFEVKSENNNAVKRLGSFDFSEKYERCAKHNVCDETGSFFDGGHDFRPVSNPEAILGPDYAGKSMAYMTTGERVFIADLDAIKQCVKNEKCNVDGALQKYKPLFKVKRKKGDNVNNGLRGGNPRDHGPTTADKGGVKSIDQIPGTDTTLNTAAPWYSTSQGEHYYSYQNKLLITEAGDEGPFNYDVTPKGKRIQFGDKAIFYKLRTLAPPHIDNGKLQYSFRGIDKNGDRLPGLKAEGSVSDDNTVKFRSQLTTSKDFAVGYNGHGKLKLHDGGGMEHGRVVLGMLPESKGEISVDGAGSTLTSQTNLIVGMSGEGVLHLSNNAKANTKSCSKSTECDVMVGVSPTSNGLVYIDGNDPNKSSDSSSHIFLELNPNDLDDRAASNDSDKPENPKPTQLESSRHIFVGYNGTGEISVRDKGEIKADQTITIAYGPDSSGTVNIGSAKGEDAVTTGRLEAQQVVFGNGDSTLNFNHTDTDYQFAIQIIGDGHVNVLAGKTILTADNRYQGGTTVTDGTLQLGDGGTSGSIVGNVKNNGTLTFKRANTVKLTGAITGKGDITQLGAGTTVLTGNNDYQGGTTIANGTLQLGDGGTSGSIVGNVKNNGTLAFNRSDDVNFAGAITGTGNIAQIGDGTTVLTGKNDYQGGTTIANGTLQLGDGGTSGSIVGNVKNNGTLAFNRSDDVNFAGAITGTGNIAQLGDGTTVLTGDNIGFRGTTDVQTGTLVVGKNGQGALGGTIKVQSGARLEGSGTLGTGTVHSNAAIAPGNSIGTMTFADDLVLEQGATYEAEINSAGQSDLIRSAGTVTIDGANIQVQAQPDGDGSYEGYQEDTRYTVVSAASGVEGEFSNVDSQDLAFLEITDQYDDQNAYLVTQRKTDDSGDEVGFSSVAQTPNQAATADAIDAGGQDSTLHNAVEGQSEAGARDAFDAASGELNATIKSALIDESHFVRNAVTARTRSASGSAAVAAPVPTDATSRTEQTTRETDEPTTWIQPYSAWGSFDGNGNAAGVDRSVNGLLIGADSQIGDHWRLGLAGGYRRSDYDVSGRRSSADVDSYSFALYGSRDMDALHLRFGAAHTWHLIDSRRRSITSPGFRDHSAASHDARTAQVFGEAGYTLDINTSASIEPFVGLAQVHTHTNGFDESGKAGLTADSDNTDVTYSTLGTRAATDLDLGGVKATARGQLGWQHAAHDITPASSHAFTHGPSFSVSGVPLADDTALVGTGLDVHFTDSAALGLSYRGQLASEATEHSLSARLEIKF
ncbi:autotransporter domain-containing protein [Salinisphaera sp. USBA-960]|nr:autotransporter domain-containing protein [Salifodinibacter halophilus]NNC26556.1 autotransporter domain-containing protein [Salifodinibacter halophilus]